VDGKPNYSTVTVTVLLVRVRSIVSFNCLAGSTAFRQVDHTTQKGCTALASPRLICCSTCSPLTHPKVARSHLQARVATQVHLQHFGRTHHTSNSTIICLNYNRLAIAPRLF